MEASQSTADRKKPPQGLVLPLRCLCDSLYSVNPAARGALRRFVRNMMLGEKNKKEDSHITGQIPVQVQSQFFSKHFSVMLSSFIETWYLGKRQLFGKGLLGVTSKALPALEAKAGLANEFQWVQHPEDHLGPHQHHSALG